MINNIIFWIFSLVLLVSCKKTNQVSQSSPEEQDPIIDTLAIRLESSSFTLGNIQAGVLDTFTLNFNKPISVNHILPKSNFCVPDLENQVSADHKSVKFYGILCGRLGEDYKFEYSVHDIQNNIKIDSVLFSYYTRKLQVSGQIVKYKITDDNKHCWVTTSSPNRLYCIGIEDSTYRKVYDLNFAPSEFTINPYNHKMYLLSNPFVFNDENKIYVIDTSNGSIDKIITVELDQYDNTNDQLNVLQLDFGANGYGALLTGTRSGPSNARWRILDSRQNDTIYVHPAWIAATNGTGNWHFGEFVYCRANYDKSKLYFTIPNSSHWMAILDCNSQSMNEIAYCISTVNHYTVLNKFSDKIFIASLYYQGISDNGTCTSFTGFDDRYSQTADFSYRSNENNFMYYRYSDGSSYQFSIIDYDNMEILMKTNIGPDFTNITSTTNGKFILAKTSKGIFIFNTDLFYRYI